MKLCVPFALRVEYRRLIYCVSRLIGALSARHADPPASPNTTPRKFWLRLVSISNHSYTLHQHTCGRSYLALRKQTWVLHDPQLAPIMISATKRPYSPWETGRAKEWSIQHGYAARFEWFRWHQ